LRQKNSSWAAFLLNHQSPITNLPNFLSEWCPCQLFLVALLRDMEEGGAKNITLIILIFFGLYIGNSCAGIYKPRFPSFFPLVVNLLLIFKTTS